MHGPHQSRFWALTRRLGALSTYRRVWYALLCTPTGLVYWVVLIGAVVMDTLAAVPHQLRREQVSLRFPMTRASWRRLATWERRHATHWLGVELTPVAQPPSATLPLLLLKLPLGYPVLCGAVAALVYAGLLVMLASRYVGLLRAHAPIPPGALPAVAALLGASVVICGAVPLVLDALSTIWSRLVALAYGGAALRQQLRDAQARAAAERANAERADRSRRELIMNVGHELRTPTATINGHVESLLLVLGPGEHAQLSDASVRARLAIVQREAERLGVLIDEFLALARNDTDRLQLELGPLNAGAVVDEVFGTLAPLARCERHITLAREVEPELPPVLADRRRLRQVLLNLVRNAVAYTPAGGIVVIVLRRDGDRALLAVHDTGIGIPAHELERIFERFHRVDPSRARSSGGFGLGLAIVRDLVAAMGGTVAVSSSEGEGSVFEVRLPFAAAQSPGRAGASDQGA